MSTGTRLSFEEAIKAVSALRQLMNLDSLCEPLPDPETGELKPRWIVAGSVRRRKPDVGDIEILTVPRASGHALFGNASSNEVADCLERMLRLRQIEHAEPRCWGLKLRRFLFRGVKFEIVMATAQTWPILLAIRTGPQEFSRSLVTQRCYGGRLPDGHRVQEGQVIREPNSATAQPETTLQFSTEREFLEFCGGWVEPKERQ